MNLNSKKISLPILGIISIVCSSAMLHLFNDPEGPNLLVIMGMALIVFVLSLASYAYHPSGKQAGHKRLLLAILIQISVTAGFYFCLR